MDNTNYSTNPVERKKGQHLGAEERGAIQHLHKLGYSNRAIAGELNCSPSTIGYELERGTPAYSGRGRKPTYSAKRGATVYKENRSRCRRPKKSFQDSQFISWLVKQVKEHKRSFDSCVGRARLLGLFPPDTIPCTKTLYNRLRSGELPLSLFDLPEILTRRPQGKPRISKRLYGKSIEERPLEVVLRNTFGHWESDTVLGQKKKGEAAVFSIVERLTGYYITLRIDEKTADGVASAMKQLHQQFGDKFNQVFRSITTDNGSEFASFSDFENLGSEVYFAHPYSSWERPVNERSNRVLRKFIPKSTSITKFSPEQILAFSDEINATPTKRLGYYTPEELFEDQLDQIYRRTKQ
ncbi:IS30 family transposase [Chakrabartyella piscis]|uniref:IS30 family transposase n=1 Tax=Chakrabartyella piscis TaxID=2918914 RepID=UPI002958D870|nr:IS30 family transposase [Chakrabartyella piscis]